MKYSYSNAQVRAADNRKIESGTPSLELMARAAEALANAVLEEMTRLCINDALFVCGGGNNGGDGFAAARILLEKGKDIAVLCLAEKLSPDCAEMKARFGGEILGRIPRRRYALIVDCLFGTGLSQAPRGDTAILIDFINASGAYVIACDLPSGLSESGYAFIPCVRADRTVTFGAMKNALLMADGADVAGKITASDIGLELEKGVEVWEDTDVKAFFPKRKSNVHKGSFGSACILASPAKYTGAAFLAAGACLKSGAGYTKLYTDESLYPSAVGKLPACILQKYLELNEDILSAQSIAVGMGAGVSRELYDMLRELLKSYRGVLVLDADALNTLAYYGLEVIRDRACEIIITPHVKEFSRLTGREVRDILQKAVTLAEGFAQEYGITVLLKGNRSILTDGSRTALITSGSPALAKGGSGDVLTGFLAGTCARGIAPFEAACVSSYLLGRAGELAAEKLGEYSVDASDVISCLPSAVLSCKSE